MGRKYGSLHVRLQNPDVTVETVKNGYVSVTDAVFQTDVKTVAERLGLAVDPQQLPLVNSLVKRACQAVKSKQWLNTMGL